MRIFDLASIRINHGPLVVFVFIPSGSGEGGAGSKAYFRAWAEEAVRDAGLAGQIVLVREDGFDFPPELSGQWRDLIRDFGMSRLRDELPRSGSITLR